MMHTDVLVIGSGISGLSYVIKMSERHPDLQIVLLSKRNLLESNTRYAQGGIAVVSDFELDSFEKHVSDTLIAGDGLCNPSVVDFVVREGPARLQELIDWGTSFDQKSDELHLEKEGGHSASRIVHHKDQSGYEIQKSLIAQVRKLKNVTILENHVLVDLITDHHMSQSAFNRCYGAYLISIKDESTIKITAKITVLSTGGGGQVYAHTTNPKGATGDGIGAAYRAKVTINHLQYVQFHPTAFYPKVKGNTFLISEAVRGAGGKLITKSRNRFMSQYDSRAELASRDIVARSIAIELKKSGDECVFLDCTHFTKNDFKKRFPTIYNTCKKAGFNPENQPIPVVPAAHYFCGGVQVDPNSKTSLDGLYAIGECSSTRLHGANRLASNSLLEALVYSHRAVLASYEELSKIDIPSHFFTTIPDWNDAFTVSSKESKLVDSLCKEIQETMSSCVGIFKSSDSLLTAEKKLNTLFNQVVQWYNQNKLTPRLCELRNLVSVSYLIVKQSQQTTENKGVFYNHDNE
ncbi:MAG: L-aspartate oxidase [Flavobacteriaceae bacterium]|nr:L-aspartate oxidase [Flavobacteriaceae bacterium]MDG2314219.1 L-aspartate oxidase [Flavobacteriaceae bacterium]